MNENKDFRTLPSNTRDFFSIIKYIGSLTKEPFSVRVGDECLHFSPPKIIAISPLFFRGGGCKRCGACCKKGITLAYTKSLYHKFDTCVFFSDELTELIDGLKEHKVKIEKSEGSYLKNFYVYNKVKSNLMCVFNQLIEGDNIWGCSIHKWKPIHCAMPLIRIIHRDKLDTTFLIKKQFGYSWAFGCPVQFKSFDLTELEEIDLPVLQRLQESAEDLDIKTYLPEIINWLNNFVLGYKRGDRHIPESAIELVKYNSGEGCFLARDDTWISLGETKDVSY